MKYLLNTLVFFTFLSMVSCKDFLDAKPKSSLVIPEKIADYQALMDRVDIMNLNTSWAGEGSADNYILTEADYNAVAVHYRNLYTWKSSVFAGTGLNDWSNTYRAIFYCNVVLDGLNDLDPGNGGQDELNNLKGSALLYRSKYFLDAILAWTKPYNQASEASSPGIPLRMNSDFNEPTRRATLEQSFEAVLSGLKQAVPLLPVNPLHLVRPSRPAAYAYLSRTYLAMKNYEMAGRYADSCLQLKSTLLDFNTLNASASYPVPRFNPEVIMHFRSSVSFANRMMTEPVLYSSYAADDLRKTVFFRAYSGGQIFKGSYDNSVYMFTGPATDEMLLTRAECRARAGEYITAIEDLNLLLSKRYRTGRFVLLTASNAEGALDLILRERRKELVLRNLRWLDLKRLNQEPQRAVTLQRTVGTQVFTLEPNSSRYAIPIPDDIVAITGIEQNK